MSDDNSMEKNGQNEQVCESPGSQKSGSRSKTFRLSMETAEAIAEKAKELNISQGTLIEQIYHAAEAQLTIDQVPGEKESLDDFTASLNHLQRAYTDLVGRYGDLKNQIREEYQRRLSEKDLKIQNLRQEAEEARAASKTAKNEAEDYMTRMLRAESEARRCMKETVEIRTMLQETSRINAMLEEKISEADQKLRDLGDYVVREAELTRKAADLEQVLKTQKISFEHCLELQKRDADFEKAESLRRLEKELTASWQTRYETLSSQNAALQAKLELLLEERMSVRYASGTNALETTVQEDPGIIPEDILEDVPIDEQRDERTEEA